ncbi:MAG: hypothetical protein NZ841_03420 [Dictyoglomus sp.]|nr:hypothetical protein [Dictyoglomus sp.]MCX7845670.1 hypothetical protein [Dictyoglomaceae bacterium]MDW8188329.1 hypothetical protein [Dictyoglomus sp.]
MKDEKFINLLNEIRRNMVTDESLELLNSRVVKDSISFEDYMICLTPCNETAAKINMEQLKNLKGKNMSG